MVVAWCGFTFSNKGSALNPATMPGFAHSQLSLNLRSLNKCLNWKVSCFKEFSGTLLRLLAKHRSEITSYSASNLKLPFPSLLTAVLFCLWTWPTSVCWSPSPWLTVVGSWPSLCTNMSSHSHQLSPGPQSREADLSTFRLRNHIPDNHHGRGSETDWMEMKEWVWTLPWQDKDFQRLLFLPSLGDRQTPHVFPLISLALSFIHLGFIPPPPSPFLLAGCGHAASDMHFFFPCIQNETKIKSRLPKQDWIGALGQAFDTAAAASVHIIDLFGEMIIIIIVRWAGGVGLK